MNSTKTLVAVLLTGGLLMIVNTLDAAEHQGCCGAKPAPAKKVSSGCAHAGAGAGCSHAAHATAKPADAKAAAEAKSALPESVHTVFTEYFRVQNALAADSFQKANAAAEELARAVRKDTDDVLPAALSQQAQALVEAGDLPAARAAFKSLSESMLKFARSSGVTPGSFVEVYCSMAKAGWLQNGKAIKNPYYGSSMLTCGQVRS